MKPTDNNWDRVQVLQHLASLAADEDTSDKVIPVFLPLPAHGLALRSDVVVVVGTRGAGKTALFRVVHELGAQVRDFFKDPGIPAADWVDAFSESGTQHPAPAVLDALAEQVGAASDAALRAFWVVHLLARLEAKSVPGATMPKVIAKARRDAANDPKVWIEAAAREIGSAMSALDAVESALTTKGRHVFASYDHLDRLGVLANTRTTRQRLLRSLLALWLSFSTRYRQLRGKVFLRPDLFDEVESGFPDASKLRPRAVPLDWDVASLYGLAVRHIANRGPHLSDARAWLRDHNVPLGNSKFGLFAAPMGEKEQKLFAGALAGDSMGSGPKKGYTYRWMLARIKDAGGRIVPRSFLRLLRHAAQETLNAGPPKQGPLMEPIRLVGALQSTSKDRVTELGDEYPFVRRVENLRDQTMLMERSKVIGKLSRFAPDGLGDDGARVFDELARIGVLEVRDDGRIDVPDIYRYGYGIKRKGGAKTPR